MAMIAACLLFTGSVLAMADALPLEVLYSTTSATQYYRLYNENGSYYLLYGTGAPSGRRRGLFRLTLQTYCVDGQDIRMFEDRLLASPISWNPDDYWLHQKDKERGPEVPYNGLIRLGTNRVLTSGIGAPVTTEQSEASRRATQLIAALDGLRTQATVAKQINARRVLSDALLNLLETTPAGVLGEDASRVSAHQDKQLLARSSVRACIAEMLVAGGLVSHPLRSAEPEIRFEGVSYYEAKLPDAHAYKALVSVLGDPVAAVRIAAASALAATVSEQDQAVCRKLERLACDKNLAPLNDHLRGILQARKLMQECDEGGPE